MKNRKNNKQIEQKFYDGFLWDNFETHPRQQSQQTKLHSAAENICSQYQLTSKTQIQATFYPYTSLKSTIKVENGITRIKISDILSDASQPVLEALVHILISRARRSKPHPDLLNLYNNYISSPDIEEKHANTRSNRSRKILSGPKGKYYDLDSIFERINTEYFAMTLSKPKLSWSPKRSRRLLGYHDGHLNLVVISRWLDRKVVPAYVVEYIMYHELLHVVVPTPTVNGRRQVHSKEFKRLERKFKDYDKANLWLTHAGLSIFG